MFQGNLKKLFAVMAVCVVLLFAIGFVIDGLSSFGGFASKISQYKVWGGCTADECTTAQKSGNINFEDTRLGKPCTLSVRGQKNGNEYCRVSGYYLQGTCASVYLPETPDATCGGVGAYCSSDVPCREGLKCGSAKRCYNPEVENKDKVGEKCSTQYDCYNTMTNTFKSLCAAHYNPGTSDPTCGGVGAYCNSNFRCRAGLNCNSYNRCA